ncbi:MAG: hypothetical protein JJE27_03545 [Thermoleophilia bacterium]|nr:hypothetical protein [Thermoleophilia bacterium]
MTAAPSQLTPEQWKRVEDALSLSFGTVDLEVDGYDVTLQVSQVAPLKFEIAPFVNGKFKGEWIAKDCEERRRFLREVTRPLYSRSRIASAAAKMSKRAGERFAADFMSGVYTSYRWTWPSFAPLKRHLVKHNTSIRLLGINGLGEPE